MPDSAKNNGHGTLPPPPAKENRSRKMTVMCFFAGDNALSPLLIHQLKAIKDAGYEEDVDVLVRFDPAEITAPTRIYHVNAERRRVVEPKTGSRRTLIGDGEDTFVRNMSEDIVHPDTIKDDDPDEASRNLKNELTGKSELRAFDALQNFVGFCRNKYPAKHYMLFLIGHGMIVGNDAFLPDDNPTSGISLTQLETVLTPFEKDGETTKDGRTTLDLLGLHSCSMSSVELAYQLKGKANYMIASQGTSYVGSWPYRQLLKKIFATVDRSRGANLNENDIQLLVEKLYHLSLYNSTDFMMAGYSSDMSLCNLQEEAVDGLTAPLKNLIDLLIKAFGKVPIDGGEPVTDHLLVSLIGKAHAESQSYWGESYTDLYDFSDLLRTACFNVIGVSDAEVEDANPKAKVNAKLKANPTLAAVADACKMVCEELKTFAWADRSKRFQKLVIRSEYFGWRFQYSHGLSIYFPWSESLEVENIPEETVAATPGRTVSRLPTDSFADKTPKPSQRSVMERYQGYKFNTSPDFAEGYRWSDFLNVYFNGTQRALRNGTPSKAVLKLVEFEDATLFKQAKTQAIGVALDIVPPDHKSSGEQAAPDHKSSGEQSGDCGCPSIKNFATRVGPKGRKVKAFSISAGAVKAFKKPLPEDPDTTRRKAARRRAGVKARKRSRTPARV